MDIDKAMEHFKFKLENVWKPSKKDIEAYTSIYKYREMVEMQNINENDSLAKLWIHQLILLANSNMYSGERCIQILDEILSKTTYEWCLRLKDELPMMRFNALDKPEVKDLHFEISEENIIKFVNLHINRIINKFEK